MPDVSRPGGTTTPNTQPQLPPTAGLDRLKYATAAEAALEPVSFAAHRVGWGFISLYMLAYMSTCLVLIAPLPVTVALKVNSLVGIEQAPNSLALVAGIILLFAVTLKDRRLRTRDKPAWSLREVVSTFYVNPWRSPDFA